MTARQRLSRRTLLAAAAVAAPAITRAQTPPSQSPSPPAAPPAPAAQLGTPPSTITNPPRDWAPGQPSIYPDPDIIVVDPAFRSLVPGNHGIKRLWTGA